ncbi:bifunctional serine/threonine-protein kinase/phosphatase [Terrihabitans sp. B22-R8]|uniref:bifunctional serine/threonine-protein kinase/phosphatase n=1 Tax=Terrihabitans sp. B22-R8 TaxID=3425128 RepID=UPI00403C7065
MPASRLVLHLPAAQKTPVTLPYVSDPPAAHGRKLPNGTILVTDEAAPSVFYKFTPWKNSELAFNEADIYARLRCGDGIPGMVRLLGISGTQEHFIRAVERSHIGALNSFLFKQTRGETLDPDLVRSLLMQIAEGMAGLHALNIVHRDLKAENVLVFGADADARNGRNVRARIADFDRSVHLPHGSVLDKPVGSLFHMAPELLSWKAYDRKVDVYAFGILMFEVAHGGARAYGNVATGMPDSIPQAEFAGKVVEEGLRPRWIFEDEDLKRIAAQCWAADPAERPEFDEIFEQLKSRSPWHAQIRANLAAGDDLAPAATVRVGIASHIGCVRRSMEDAACVLETPLAQIAAVFDGLRGAEASTFAARRLAMALADDLAGDGTDPSAAIARAFGTTDATMREMDPAMDAGSTASIAVVSNDDLLLAWLGDSPAYLFRNSPAPGEISSLSLVERHLPGREEEAARISAAGGIVDREKRWMDSGEAMPWGPLRVFVPASGRPEGIAVSRALGLFSFKPAIGNEPDMVRIARTDDDLFLVLGSDGVFDVLAPSAVLEAATASETPQQAADAIITAVLAAGAPDNASVIVIDLKRPSDRN